MKVLFQVSIFAQMQHGSFSGREKVKLLIL